jgi:thiamine biosynthesis lipoprotein
MQPLLGTFVEIGAETAAGTQRAIGAAFAAIAEVHRLMSFQAEDSDLSRLNRAGGAPVELDPLTIRVLRLARALTRTSGGRFNCTVGGALERLGALPSPGGTAELASGDADDIEILDRRTARLCRPIHVTLDGIAKGFAVDRAVRALGAHGVASGWVNAGGDLRVVGGVPSRLIVRESDGCRAIGRIADCAVASSGVAASPNPSFPARIVAAAGSPAKMGSWTVLARRCWRADALTKVAALLPDPERAATIERLGGKLIATATATATATADA